MPAPTVRAKRFPVTKLSAAPSPLLYADSERDANQRYFTGMSVPDAFLAFGVGRKKYGVFNALEFARARKESALDVVLSLEDWRERAGKRFPTTAKIGTAEIVATLAHEFGLKRFVVPEDFPAKLAFELFDLGLAIGFADGSFGTILYLANGASSFAKERIEVFVEQRVLQLDNFRKLKGFGWPGFNKLNLWRQDKGQKACAAAFVRAVEAGGPAPIAFDEILEVARISIEVAKINCLS